MKSRRTFRRQPRSLAPPRRKRKQAKPPSPLHPLTDGCWLAQFDPEHACEGPLERAHLVREQFLRDAVGLTMTERWAPEWYVPSCRRHHRRFDAYRFRLTREQLPARLERAAERHPRAAARLTRDFGPRPRLIERAA